MRMPRPAFFSHRRVRIVDEAVIRRAHEFVGEGHDGVRPLFRERFPRGAREANLRDGKDARRRPAGELGDVPVGDVARRRRRRRRRRKHCEERAMHFRGECATGGV